MDAKRPKSRRSAKIWRLRTASAAAIMGVN